MLMEIKNTGSARLTWFLISNTPRALVQKLGLHRITSPFVRHQAGPYTVDRCDMPLVFTCYLRNLTVFSSFCRVHRPNQNCAMVPAHAKDTSKVRKSVWYLDQVEKQHSVHRKCPFGSTKRQCVGDSGHFLSTACPALPIHLLGSLAVMTKRFTRSILPLSLLPHPYPHSLFKKTRDAAS
jgi:hypothetical protein